MTESEIDEVFNKKEVPIEKDYDTGVYGEVVGVCPKCGENVIRNRYGYGCIGYKEGCNFKISGVICNRVISKDNAKLLLEKGQTSKIKGFTSKNGKLFDAILILNNDKIEFRF